MDQRTQKELVIVQGADVVSVDGAKIGGVREVFPDYIVVEKGFFFPSDHYIPATAISDANEDTVYLNVSKEEALQQGWETPPATTTATTPVTDTAPVETSATTDGETWETGARPATMTNQHLDTDETVRVPLAAEELTATKRPVEQGRVRVTKDVEEREQTLDVPVRQEQVNVERRAVDRDVTPDETAFQEGTIEVPARGEAVDVAKRSRVGEEVEIRKQATEATKQVSGTVRQERAHVEHLTGTDHRTGTDTPVNTTDATDERPIDQAQDTVTGTTRNRGR